ncbi:MAG: hypothetical protein [Microviridae sp.]|nr:MAG: hypothetical protein [Microviridae sp.]
MGKRSKNKRRAVKARLAVSGSSRLVGPSLYDNKLAAKRLVRRRLRLASLRERNRLDRLVFSSGHFPLVPLTPVPVPSSRRVLSISPALRSSPLVARDKNSRRRTCKERPNSKLAARGSGGSRSFVPWCDRKK